MVAARNGRCAQISRWLSRDHRERAGAGSIHTFSVSVRGMPIFSQSQTRVAQQRLPSHDRQGVVYANFRKLVLDSGVWCMPSFAEHSEEMISAVTALDRPSLEVQPGR